MVDDALRIISLRYVLRSLIIYRDKNQIVLKNDLNSTLMRQYASKCYLKHIVEIYEDTGDKRHYMLPLSRKTKEIKKNKQTHSP